MKRFICFFVVLFSVTVAFSQKVYFVYFQAENDQPFYLKMNETTVSSSGSGYLILSRLRDTSYSFSIGFPGNRWTEQSFRVDIKGKDHGYLLKNFGEKWGLFDLQTLSVQMSASPAASSGTQGEVSAFTDILSRAANDPTLKEKPVAVKQEEKVTKAEPVVAKKEDVIVQPKDNTIQEAAITKPDSQAKKENPVVIKQAEQVTPVVEVVAKQDTPVVKKQEVPMQKDEPQTSPVTETVVKEDAPVKKEEAPVQKEEPKALPANDVISKAEVPVKKEEPVLKQEEYKPSVVRRRSESSTTEGFGLVFVDEYPDGNKDTIRIVIPHVPQRPVVITEAPKDEKKFLDITTETKDVSAETKPVAKAVQAKQCSPATENDFLRLRKRMAAEGSDDAMVKEAVKSFKTKCFTVVQVKNLSALFLNDAGKYKFFDAAYQAVADPESFPTLSGELKDEYYINRFKAMLR